ncbi:MAG TPA: hypothetical protein VFV93_12205 [Thermomicrobiales bacterium]|nr:hypothetical protein [Thermomicrobiales bacterium]
MLRRLSTTLKSHQGVAMPDTADPNTPVTITLERWRWEQILLCLDRYVAWLRGEYSDDDAMSDDVEWADELGWMTDDLRAIVNASGSHPVPPSTSFDALSPQLGEEAATFVETPPPNSAPKRNPPWNSSENDAAIAAYFWMLGEQDAFRDFNKRAKYQELMDGPLNRRSRKSIEFKMCNISAVFQRHGIEWVEGLAPLGNAQADLAVAVEEALAERGMIDQTTDAR